MLASFDFELFALLRSSREDLGLDVSIGKLQSSDNCNCGCSYASVARTINPFTKVYTSRRQSLHTYV